MTQPFPATRCVQQTQVYRLASAQLLEAITRYQDAKAEADRARDDLDDRRAALLLGGVPGLRDRCPAEEREAHLTRALAAQVQAHRCARDGLRRAEAELEAARIAERTERETLRTLHLEPPRVI